MATRIGLVLGAGGYAGQAFHAGVLTALQERTGWDPRDAEVVVGTSAGAVVAAWLRVGLGAPDLHAFMRGERLSPGARRLVRRESRHGLAEAAAGRNLSPASLPLLVRMARRPRELSLPRLITAAVPRGTRPTTFISEATDRATGGAWPRDETLICAVDLATGWRVVFGARGQPRATPGEAVAASCAIPGYFAPVRVGEREYIDGAVYSPTNADLLVGRGLDLVLVSSPMSVSRGSARRSLDLPARLHARRVLGREGAALRAAGTEVRFFQPCSDDLASIGLNAMDPATRSTVAETVRDSAARRLQRADWVDRLAGLAQEHA